MRRRTFVLALVVGLATPASSLRPVSEFTTFTAFLASPLKKLPARQAWKEAAPGVREIRIRSSADGSRQPALFYAPESEEPRPLLVVLHSWSVDYLDHASIPYGVWAMRNGWSFIHPNFRGRFDDPSATGSELAVQDIVDAVEYARKNARVDASRIYLVGYSGGGMMALTMAGRYPELWAGAVAWVPVFDLVEWHRETKNRYRRYAREIRQSCGGEPVEGTKAYEECRRRSAGTHLPGALGSQVRLYIAAGIDDPFVSPRHAFSAFNLLANEEDRFSEDEIARLCELRDVPPGLSAPAKDPSYETAGRPVLLQRTSGQATLLVFRGRHDVIYNAGLMWLAEQKRE